MTQTTLYFYIKRILSAFVAITILSSCAGPKINTNKKNSASDQVTNNTNASDSTSANEYLLAAKDEPSDKAIALLFLSANKFIDENNSVKSLWLANKLNNLNLNEQQGYALFLLKARALFNVNSIEDAEEQLAFADQFANKHSLSNSYDFYILDAAIQKYKGNNIRASYASLTAFSLNETSNESDIMSLWNQLSVLSTWELNALARLQPPLITGWLSLVKSANEFGDNKAVFDLKLQAFLLKNIKHPASFIAKQLLLVTEIPFAEIKHVAILLPLSGNNQTIGETVQQGLLSAYNEEELTLHFIDTYQLDFSTIPMLFKEKNIDHVVGPLLKSNVDSYVNLAEVNLPTILLNTPTISSLREQHYAFSMKREDEALQIATVLANKSYKHPVIFTTQDRVSQRIASNFARKWESLTGSLPERVMIETKGDMQKSLKDSLDIDASKARIKELEGHIRQKIETETRNRRDIDMIFLAAPSKYTRLIKPFIDVNTSTYSKLIPIFGSSLSHSGKNDESEVRDLSDLSFSEIPWFLTSAEQNISLVNTSETLWPNRPESLQRIYAMGYDVFFLLKKLNAFNKAPYIRHKGQTGEIQLAEDQFFTRSLLWGKYTNGEVKQVEME